jgi:hypothetical protein
MRNSLSLGVMVLVSYFASGSRLGFAQQSAEPASLSPMPISWAQVFLVVVSLLCCVGCIWMVFFFGRGIQTYHAPALLY